MSVLGTVAATVTGFFTGWNPQAMAIAYSVGSGVDSVVNQPDRVGPRLEDLRVQMSQYGATIPFEWGCNRHAGTIIWPKILEAVEHKEEESSKGGPDTITYKYTLSCAVLVCEGPIAGIRRIWANKRLVYDKTNYSVETREDIPVGRYPDDPQEVDPSISGIRIYLGTEDQGLDPLIEATDGEGPAYRGYAYVVFEDYDVTELNGRPPLWEFEVITDSNTDVPPTTSFGEKYDLAIPGSATFGADIDDNRHMWLHTMGGRAWMDPDTGEIAIDPHRVGVPQIQEYDSATGELLWFYNVPAIYETWSEGSPPQEIYPIGGTGIYSGGYYFVGRGAAGFPNKGSETPGYAHGLAVNTESHAVELFYNTCSSSQFQNAFYWPTVPVPVIDNNKVFFASSTGTESVLGVGFMPASIMGSNGAPDTDPSPDYTSDPPSWDIPVGWTQARAKGSCPVPGPDGPKFDGTGIRLPSAAVRSLSIHNPEGAVVQGFTDAGSFVSIVTNSVRVTGFDTTAPNVATYMLPSSASKLPAVAWDAANSTLWAFAGPDGNQLFSIAPGAGGPTFTGFMLSNADGLYGNAVRALAIDTATGLLRVVQGFGLGKVSLIDPIAGSVVSEAPITLPIEPETGLLWDVPGKNEVIYTNGFRTLRIPIGPTLAPNGIPLGRIVRDICLRAGLEDDDIDVSELTDQVDGYIVPRQMMARAAIEPLQQCFFFDAVESDDKLKFVKRGASEVTVIPLEDRAAHENGQEVPDALTITRAFELELPVQCDVEYPDIDADHLIGNQSDKRITKDTRHNLNLQLPVVMTAEKAKSVARTLLYEAWQNQTFAFTTTRKYAHLEPTDIVELPTESASYRGRITAKRERPAGIIEWEARVDAVTVYTQTGDGAAPIDHVPQTIFKPGVTYLEMLDIPLLRDEDEGAGFYVAMGGV